MTGEGLEMISREVRHETGVECVAISAVRRETLRPLAEEIGGVIGKSGRKRPATAR